MVNATPFIKQLKTMAITCAISTGYTKTCRDAVGGIKTVYITELANKSSITQASGIITAFALTAGKKFYTFEMTQATANASSDPKPNKANGTFYYDQKLKIEVPKRLASFSYQLKNLAVQDLMVIILDMNGDYWLLGENNGMAMVDSVGAYGTQMADKTGHELNFNAMEGEDAKQVTSGLMAALTA